MRKTSVNEMINNKFSLKKTSWVHLTAEATVLKERAYSMNRIKDLILKKLGKGGQCIAAIFILFYFT